MEPLSHWVRTKYVASARDRVGGEHVRGFDTREHAEAYMAGVIDRMRSEGAASLIRRVALQRGRTDRHGPDLDSAWIASASFYDDAQGLSADDMYACRVFEWQVHADACNRRKTPGKPLEISPWDSAHGPAPVYDAAGCVDTIVVRNPYTDDAIALR